MIWFIIPRLMRLLFFGLIVSVLWLLLPRQLFKKAIPEQWVCWGGYHYPQHDGYGWHCKRDECEKEYREDFDPLL